MIIDVVVAEIGSTTTVVNAFHNLTTNPSFLAQGIAKTTINDVNIGLNAALDNLKHNLKADHLTIKETFASSSAAGGLKMSVHGLVYDMTVKAAKEAALGAGANLHLITAGKLNKYDLKKLQQLNLNIIMIAGGVDYGESETSLYNAQEIAKLRLNIPIIYAGNIVNHEAVKEIFTDNLQSEYLYITENVYPKIDIINVNEARKIIQAVFEEHITKAIGMEKVKELVNGPIIPTPGAVMEASILLQKKIGDLVTIDIGGATTDIHSVVDDNLENKLSINPEPFIKRTVEGDLGVYINIRNIIKTMDKKKLLNELSLNELELDDIINNLSYLPLKKDMDFIEKAAIEALNQAMSRHAGRYRNVYGGSGIKKMIDGKDLTNVKYLIGTGGVLSMHPSRFKIMHSILLKEDIESLKPNRNTKILIDNDYIMASLGVLSIKYPEAALMLLENSLKSEV